MADLARFSGQLIFVFALWCGCTLFIAPVIQAQSATPPTAWYSVTSLPVALADRNAILREGFIYVIGGKTPQGPLAAVYRNTIGPGVELAPNWTKLPTLVRRRHSHATVMTDAFVYTVGGLSINEEGREGISSSLYYSQFLNDGELAGWDDRVHWHKLPFGIYASDATLLNNYLYLAGGATDKDKASQRVYVTQLKVDGSVDNEKFTASLPKTSLHHALVGYQNWLYVIGGLEDTGKAIYSHIYRAEVKPDGSLAAWSYLTDLPDSATNPQPKGRYYSEALIRDGHLLVLGGRDATQSLSDVLSAPILADGTLGPWQFLPPLPAPRHRFGAALGAAGQIYITGGLHLTGTQKIEDVYHAEVYVLTQLPAPVCYLTNTPFTALAAGASVTYKVTCRVTPSFPVNGVTVSIPVPEGITFQRAEQGGTLSFEQTNVVWQLGNQDPSQEFSVTYHGQASSAITPTVAIVNPGATIDWQFRGQPSTATTNLVVNSSSQSFLPAIHK